LVQLFNNYDITEKTCAQCRRRDNSKQKQVAGNEGEQKPYPN